MEMNSDQYFIKSCACKGKRTCLKCEKNIDKKSYSENFKKIYLYCEKCGNQAYDSEKFEKHCKLKHENNTDELSDDELIDSIKINGIYLQKNILTDDEECELIEQIDSFKWIDSQSGRRKQDFGPKINFKKHKINFEPFIGLPKLDVELLHQIRCKRLHQNNDFEKFQSFPLDDLSDNTILNRFLPIEICHLEYCPERGSSIDPHFDDEWIWGERLVTINLLSSTVITLTDPYSQSNDYCIRIELPRKSLLVLYDEARYRFHHSIKRSDINQRRLAITYRELAYEFLEPHLSNDKNANDLMIKNEFINRSKNLIDYNKMK